jgi:hypothetical protein
MSLENRVRELKEDRDSWRRNYFMAVSVVSPQFWFGIMIGTLVGWAMVALMLWRFH